MMTLVWVETSNSRTTANPKLVYSLCSTDLEKWTPLNQYSVIRIIVQNQFMQLSNYSWASLQQVKTNTDGDVMSNNTTVTMQFPLAGHFDPEVFVSFLQEKSFCYTTLKTILCTYVCECIHVRTNLLQRRLPRWCQRTAL